MRHVGAPAGQRAEQPRPVDPWKSDAVAVAGVPDRDDVRLPVSSTTATCATSPASRTACSAAGRWTAFSGHPADPGARGRARSAGGQRIDHGLGEHAAQDLLDLVELGLADDQRRRELDHRVAAVVGPAVQAGVEQRLGEEAAQQPLGLVVVEGLLGGLVLDELDPVEVAVAAHVADDRQVEQLLQRRAEGALVAPHVRVEALALEDVEVGQRHGGRHRVAAEGVAVREVVVPVPERLEEPVGRRSSRRWGSSRTSCPWRR